MGNQTTMTEWHTVLRTLVGIRWYMALMQSYYFLMSALLGLESFPVNFSAGWRLLIHRLWLLGLDVGSSCSIFGSLRLFLSCVY